ncbi:MAG: transcription elongation factor GreA [Pseudolabrys sp.]|nr:transcription elongation factor GreA [Pseudolabrys sp.]
MSRAFVREDDQVSEPLPERPISAHPNLVTEHGRDRIDKEVHQLRADLARAQAASDRDALARVSRDLHYWEQRRASAQVQKAPETHDVVQFGSTVTIVRDDGRRQTWQIVGEDEADPSRGSVSYVSPLAKAITGRKAGDVIKIGEGEAEIVAIE